MHPSLHVLRELVILAGVSLTITLLFQRLRIAAITGFMLTGVLIGPGGFGLVSDPDTVHTLAEIGVVVLLFMVGLEFSVADLRALGLRPVLVGCAQVTVTAAVVALGLMLLGAHPARAVFFGLLVALSSTALLLKLYTDRAELQSAYGRLALGVLLLQDLALVPLTLLSPLLADWARGTGAKAPGLSGLMHAGFLMLATVLAIAIAWRFVPWVIARASRARSREAFLAAILLVVLGSSYLSQLAGLSLALGAFLAGLILAGSELRSQVAADVLPFRDTLSSVFFISIGMLFSPAALLEHPGIIAAATVGVIGLKALATFGVTRMFAIPWKVAIPVSLALAHAGEFSFVLARTGAANGLLTPTAEQAFIAAAMFSLLLAPWLVARGPDWGMRLELARATRGGASTDAMAPDAHGAAALEHGPRSALVGGHVVVAGYGLNGQNVTRVLRAVRIPHLVLDHAPEAIAACGVDGSEGLLGNAVQPEILRRAGIPRARAMVLALSDPFATRHAAQLARQMNPHLFVVVRTRYVREIDAFYEAGANVVIPEEFETSIEIFTAVLRQFHVPHNIVQAQVDLLRRERYSLMRGTRLPGSVIEQLDTLLAEGTTETVLILQHSPAIGRSLEDMGLAPVAGPETGDLVPAGTPRDGQRSTPPPAEQTAFAFDEKTGELTTAEPVRRPPVPSCTVIAVVRGGSARTRIPDSFRIMVGDTLVLTGAHAHIDAAIERLSPSLGG